MSNPCDRILALVGEAEKTRRESTTWREVATARQPLQQAEELLAECPELRGEVLFQQADVGMMIGDPETERLYREAIAAEPNKAIYAIRFADYLRNFRGPLAPLQEAEGWYYSAQETLDRERSKLAPSHVADLQALILRGLTAYYERDGVPLLYTDTLPFVDGPAVASPVVFFSTQNRYGGSDDQFEQQDAVRDLTLAALFAGSSERLGRPLTEDELQSLIDRREQFETFNRLRFRYRNWPVIDLYYSYLEAADAQITNFYEPGGFNDVTVSQYGLGIERTFDWYPALDALFRVEFAGGERTGLIEFEPDAREDYTSIGATMTLSRFWGPDKLSLESSFVWQDIDQQISTAIDRELTVVGATFRYQIYSPATFGRDYAPRASEFFAGFAQSRELFADVDLYLRDYYFGMSLRGLGWLDFGRQTGRLDLTLQPTFYTGNTDGTYANGLPAESLSNSQYRTAFAVLYRIEDYDNEAMLDRMPSLGPLRLATLGVVLPLSQTVAIEDIDSYDSVRVGVDFFAKSILDLSMPSRYFGVTTLATAGAAWQRFYHLDEDLWLFNVNLRIGF